ncbi:MAG: alkaline phosphatase family protein [Deltaproteobacteria bacterium]|nr:alkaline phosphatase family protein [Deltaproteobacteria bacterium]
MAPLHPDPTLALYAACLATSAVVGLTYNRRCNVEAGFLQDRTVTVDHGPRAEPPRRAVFVLVDGLSLEGARSLPGVARMARHGHCAETALRQPTMSMPTYTEFSTGLEPSRTGVRSNAWDGPAAPEDTWHMARARGLSTALQSDGPWWADLFPGAFDVHVRSRDAWEQTAALGRVIVIHELAPDDAGHADGAASPEYAAAVQHTGERLDRLLAALDLERDLLLFTSDHGHRPLGGHGGNEDDIAVVLTCAVGRGVVARPGRSTLDATAVAPLWALLTGDRFPRHLRVGPGDGLDAIWAWADPRVLGDGVMAARRAAVVRGRAGASALLRDLGAEDWDALEAQGHRAQARQWSVGLAALLLAACAWAWRRHRSPTVVLLAVAVLGLPAAALWLWKGTFSLSMISTRLSFVVFTSAVTLAAAAVAGWIVRHRVAAVLALAAVLGTAVAVLHVVIHGWQVGYPWPAPALAVLPYYLTVVTCTVCLPGAALRRRMWTPSGGGCLSVHPRPQRARPRR